LTGAVDTELTLVDLAESTLIVDGIVYAYGKVLGETVTKIIIPVEDGLVIDMYYERNKYAVVLNLGTGIEAVSGAGTYYYGASVTINATIKTGYAWVNWTGYEIITQEEYTFTMPTEKVTFVANAIDITIPEIAITLVDFNTFKWTASDTIGQIAGYAITTSASLPGVWNADATSGNFDVTEAVTYYVHVKDDSGNTASASITAYTLTIVQGKGTSLMVTENDMNGALLANGEIVLHGTAIYADAEIKTGYQDLVMKDGLIVVLDQ
jgi:hypothetical protein